MPTQNFRADFSNLYAHFFTQLKNSWVNVQIQKEFRNLLLLKQNDKVEIDHSSIFNLLKTCLINHFSSKQSYKEKVIIEIQSPIGSIRQKPIRLRGHRLLKIMDSTKGVGSEWVYEWTFVTIYGFLESLISDITKIAYCNNPSIYKCQPLSSFQSNDEFEEEIEKTIQSRMFGNLVEVLDTNKLMTNINLASIQTEVSVLREIIQRRNVIVHNSGRVNQKYIKNLVNAGIQSQYKVNDKVKIDDMYFENAIKTLDKIGSEYANQLYFQITGDHQPLSRTKR